LTVFLILSLDLVTAAQYLTANSSSTQLDRYDKKTYVDQSGTQEVMQTLETEHHAIGDWEVEIQRYRAPAWPGDNSVSWEREVRTRKLPDGSIEKEYVFRNPDGSGKLVPVQVTHEKTTSGGDSTVVQREVLQQVGSPDLQPVQKEQITEKVSNNAEQVVTEIQRHDTSYQWQTVERETSLTSTSRVGGTIQTETKSVRQIPGVYGTLADFERREERIVTGGQNETREWTVFQRDNATLDPNQFFLLDHTVEVTTVAPGVATRHVIRESERNMYSEYPEVVEERTTMEKVAPDGSRQTVTKVSGRSPVDPSVVRTLFTVVENSDTAGYVRQVSIPAQ
jgi:hypothetical protein